MPDGIGNDWPREALGKVLRRREMDVSVTATGVYQFAGVYSFGRGVFRGQRKVGSQFSYAQLTRLSEGNVVFPKLMAWEGAIGVVPAECAGLVVSPEFPVFEIDAEQVVPRFLDIALRQPSFWPQLAGGSTGTNVRRRRLQPNDFLRITISLPPIDVQRRIVSRVDALCAKIDEAVRLRKEIDGDSRNLVVALALRADLSDDERRLRGWNRVPFHEVIVPKQEPVKVDPNATYPNVGMLGFGRGLFKKPDISGQTTSATVLHRIRSGQVIYSRLFAFEGAFGVVPDHFDGHFVSNEYPTFECDLSRALPAFVGAYLRAPSVWESLARSANGLGNRRQRVQPEALLAHEIWLPPLSVQKRVALAAAAMEVIRPSSREQTNELSALRTALIERALRGEQ